MKRLLKLVCFIMICIVLSACGKDEEETMSKKNKLTAPLEQKLKTAILNVEKADCIILWDDTHTVMIDTGYGRSFDIISPFLEEHKITTIDYLILTHFDKDHIGSADHVLRNYKVKHVLMPSYESSVKQYRQLKEAIQETKIAETLITKETSFSLGEATYTLYPANKQVYKQGDNDYSLGVHLNYGNHNYFFAGDAEKERIEEFLALKDISSDVYKVPHHGVREENSRALIEKIKPTYAIITDSKEEPAEQKLLAILDQAGATTYATQKGSVFLVDDGVNLEIKQK